MAAKKPAVQVLDEADAERELLEAMRAHRTARAEAKAAREAETVARERLVAVLRELDVSGFSL